MSEEHVRYQFDLQALIFSMLVISVGLAHLRALDRAHVAPGLAAAGAALVLGTLVGAVAGRIADAQYWSVLGATFAFISAVDIVDYHWAWAATGALTGAAVGSISPGRPLRKMLAGAVTASAVFGFYALAFWPGLPGEFLWDLGAAPVIGALFGLLVEAFAWLESRAALPRYASATVLMLAICGGNYLAR